MNPKARQLAFASAIALILITACTSLRAEDAEATLSGKVTDSSGAVVPGAKVSVRNANTGQSTDAQTDSTGAYSVTLPPGDYEVSATVDDLGAHVAKATLASGNSQTVDLVLIPLSPAQAPTGAPGSQPPQNLPNAPSSSKTAPSLEDLGFSKSEQEGNAREQALLDKRTHMLKIHQRMGLITAAPLLATIITSVNAGGKKTSTTSRDLHTALGAVTGDLYFITAYYAIRAPKPKGIETKGPIRVHKALAWIHGPGMILTPILGAIAFDQKSKGEKVHGIAAAHGPVAFVTAGAFGAALLSVSVKF
jgi:hypothetical protein